MIVRFADFCLDTGRRELLRGGVPVHVEPQVFDLIAFLIAERERVVSRDELFAAVWEGRIVSEATLSSRINAARKALDDDGEAQRLIRTLPRRGFRFVGTIDGVTAPPKTGAAETLEQDIRFATTADGVRLAIAEVGRGAALVKTANWLNHVEYDWQSPVWSPTFGRWAARYRLVRYDQRGTGLSDREVSDISFEAFVADLETVVAATGLERFALFGISQGGAVAIAYAARHPERVSRLVLHGTYALGRRKRETRDDDDQAAAYLTLIRHGWGYRNSAFMQAFSSLYLPGGTSEQVRWFSDLQRETVSPENAVRIRLACDDIDVTALLPKVRAPTLVTHSRDDNVVPFDHGRSIASAIPDARFIGLPSSNHVILPGEPAWEQFMAATEAFLGDKEA